MEKKIHKSLLNIIYKDGFKLFDSFNNISKDEELTLLKRILLFLQICSPGISCIVFPLIFIPILLPFPPEPYQWCAYILILMASFWVSECIPLAVTSFLPVALFPITGIMDTLTTCKCYMNDTILMFIGSLMLACAVEQSGLHKRLALAAIRSIGYSHYRLLFAMSFITMFVSMWITNTAATTMMVPINFAILTVFQEQNLLRIYDVDIITEEIVATDITTCYFCAVTYSATIGGIGTLVGTATNLVFKGLFTSSFPDAPEYLSFPKYSAFAIPYMLVMEMFTYLSLIVIYLGFLRPKSNEAKLTNIPPEGIAATKAAVDDAWGRLGKITFWEIMVAVLFSTAILLFFCRAPQVFKGWGTRISDSLNLHDEQYVLDSAAAFLVVFMMLLLPSLLDFFYYFKPNYSKEWPQQSIPSIINYVVMNETLSYNFMFLLGGGFALSKAAKKEYTDLNGRIGHFLKKLGFFPNSVNLLFIIIFTVFVTNFASNVAVCNVITPIAIQMATELEYNPLWYVITTGMSASYCFCLPVGTPGNLVVQSAASIPTMKMVIAGLAPTFFCILTSWFCFYFWAPVIWPILKDGSPSWLNSTIVPIVI